MADVQNITIDTEELERDLEFIRALVMGAAAIASDTHEGLAAARLLEEAEAEIWKWEERLSPDNRCSKEAVDE